MHIAVSWDISEGPDRDQINQQMLAIINPHGWAKPLTTFYVIKIDPISREAICDGLLRVAQAYPTRVRFVVTPLMQGTYFGYLNQDMWSPVNERTS